MSALQFLNKKSWHTHTIKNNEKVWIREQEATREKARIEELQKQMEEERRQQDLQALEEQNGRLDPAALIKRRRLNWMYEYGRDDAPETVKAKEEKEREDVMLGKKKVNLENMEDKKREQRAALVDEEAKLREDPLSQLDQGISTNINDENDSSEKARLKALRKEERKRIRDSRKERRERKKRRRSENFDEDQRSDEERRPSNEKKTSSYHSRPANHFVKRRPSSYNERDFTDYKSSSKTHNHQNERGNYEDYKPVDERQPSTYRNRTRRYHSSRFDQK